MSQTACIQELRAESLRVESPRQGGVGYGSRSVSVSALQPSKLWFVTAVSHGLPLEAHVPDTVW